ncbi:Protein transport protein sec39 [Pleurostoma richardsiae]|uniref:Protein transport protein sec39 n=1 Tax=Pleurostoma richardsiae TaxID=41990 RepID=A0AA38RBA0_9PEZI|nr:Protein transport protein sec39 [Pleurostoma richardsiae]
MALVLSAPKTVLLAVQLAAKADIDSLAFLAARHGTVLRKELLLRILLTYLPETLKSAKYVSFVESIEKGELDAATPVDIDLSPIEHLSNEQAAKKVRKLHLLPLSLPNAPEDAQNDPTTIFLLKRAYKVDEEAGLLTQLPELLVPFLDHAPSIRIWMISVLLPLLRRNYEYYPDENIPQTLTSFETLSDRAAIGLLLSQTGADEQGLVYVGRDLRGLLGPWLYDRKRWATKKLSESTRGASSGDAAERLLCVGWEQFLLWLTSHASKSWKVAVSALEQWDGPDDFDLGGYGQMELDEDQREYLRGRYARAALASAYLIPETSVEALTGAHTILTKTALMLHEDPVPPIEATAAILPPFSELMHADILSPRNSAYLRNGLLDESNILTAPSESSLALLQALIVSAFLMSRLGPGYTVRRAGELALLQDEREQKAEALKLIHAISNNGPKSDDRYWIRARNEVLWLRDWGAEDSDTRVEESYKGVFGQVQRELLEVEILKALLAHTKYALARSIYEDSPDRPLPKKALQDTVFAAAMNAYDNASNPNRTRGGLKKCDDIIHAFPETVERSLVATQRVEALLKATHALGDYRLVLKKGEPFTPVVLRVHQDPISIIGKVLEQNPKSYTKIQDLIDVGSNMVVAGLTMRDKSGHSTLTPEEEPEQLSIAEKRITAMCIDAALTEDDFETAYSYVVNRLAAISEPARSPARKASSGATHGAKAKPPARVVDDWSWKAALQAGKYRRTSRTVRPTHLGTASGNPEIRHLEQRMECLATALRIAPPATLQEILNAFRRCEEELDSAVKAEAEQESAWDEAADLRAMPGGFSTSPGPHGAAATSSKAGATSRQHAEEAPLSLFDLSRATVRSAQRNFTALSSLQLSTQARSSESPQDHSGQDGAQQRIRKRDQLREAAMGTLVSGVGWLVGAQPTDRNQERE